MNASLPRFPDYGDDGDLAGAHRSRKAFRLCVAAVILLTGFMCFSDRFLRYGPAETRYLSAITLPHDSARVFLLAAIKLDAQSSESPTAKYTQALAVRQEDDVILDTYARAWELDATNALFAVRQGCRLFLLGRPNEALDKFRTARELPPRNALPSYLEATSIAQSGKDLAALRDAMVQVSRTNNAGEPLIFPKPLWFSRFPEDGAQFAFLQREIVDEACAPLYHLSQQVNQSVRRQLEANRPQHTKTWLDELRRMGSRLVSDSDPRGTLQAIAGITIEQEAIESLERLARHEGLELDPALIERRVKLGTAMDVLVEFENARAARLEQIELEHVYPLKLTGYGLGLMLVAYFLALTGHKLMRLRKRAWALPHSTLGKWTLGSGVSVLFVLLLMMMTLQRIPDAQPESARAIGTVWWAVIAVLMAFGWLYPVLMLRAPEEVSRKSGRPEEMPNMIRLARQAYRRVYAALVVRYYGILSGLSLCMFCVWVVLYRIVNQLYPWQINLLSDGLLGEEVEVVERVLGLLS